MIWGYHYFWKHPYTVCILFSQTQTGKWVDMKLLDLDRHLQVQWCRMLSPAAHPIQFFTDLLGCLQVSNQILKLFFCTSMNCTAFVHPEISISCYLWVHTLRFCTVLCPPDHSLYRTHGMLASRYFRVSHLTSTPPETKSEFTPENGWLEYKPFLLGPGLFSGAMLVSGRVNDFESSRLV